jgi:hypothetical protein
MTLLEFIAMNLYLQKYKTDIDKLEERVKDIADRQKKSGIADPSLHESIVQLKHTTNDTIFTLHECIKFTDDEHKLRASITELEHRLAAVTARMQQGDVQNVNVYEQDLVELSKIKVCLGYFEVVNH